ncbi:hypothetical protein, partial [Streptomyces sp. NPDC048473]|uniref:hypothetical protein n=1 Tax=Streptomyces sp. NPDC048473 TaxID=3365556 RepID=UPI00371EEFC5
TTPTTPDTPTAAATATVHHRVDDSGPADTLLPRGGGAFLRPPQLEGDGALSRARQWADYREERDTVYHRRLAFEERFERATGDLSEDIADGARRFEGLFGGDGRQGGPVREYAEESYRAQLRTVFRDLAQRAGPEGVTPEQWQAAHRRAREEVTWLFRQGAERERHEEMFRGDFDRALADFRGGDLFGGRYLTQETSPGRGRGTRESDRSGEMAREDLLEEAQSTDVPHTLHELRVRMRLRYLLAVDDAYQTPTAGAGHDPALREEVLSERISVLRGELADGIRELSAREREVEHLTRRFDEALENWQEDLAQGGMLSETAETRAREDFQKELRTAYAALRATTGGDSGGPLFGARWQTHQDRVTTLPALHERFEYTQLREMRLEQARRVLTEAADAFENDLAGGGPLHENGRERLTQEWDTSVERSFDEHWFGREDREDFRVPPTAASLDHQTDTDPDTTPPRHATRTPNSPATTESSTATTATT